MILSSLRLHTLRQIIIVTSIVAVTGIMYFATVTMADNRKEAARVLETEILSTRNQIKTLETEKAAFEESSKLWDSLKLGTQSLDGLKTEEGRKVLTSLEHAYKIQKLAIELTAPQKLENPIYQTDNFYVEGSIVSLRFEAITDEYAIGFINAIMRNMPGYVRIDQVSLRKSSPLTPDTISRLSKGETVTLVSGDLTFLWQGLKAAAKKKEEVPVAASPEGGEAPVIAPAEIAPAAAPETPTAPTAPAEGG
jgi:hypothetical protein